MVKGSRAPIAVLCGLLALSAAAILIAWSTGSWTQPAASPSHGGTLTVHIHLDSTHVVAGLNLNGYVLLTNNTRRRLALEGCPAEWLLVGLQSASIPFNPAIADDCFGKTPLGPLQSRRVAVSVSTTYTSCGGGSGGPQGPSPPCPKFGSPQLPLGVYTVKVVQLGLPKGATVAPAAPVTIVNEGKMSMSSPETSSVLIQATGCGWSGTRASMRVPVSVTVSHDGTIVGRAWARGSPNLSYPPNPTGATWSARAGTEAGRCIRPVACSPISTCTRTAVDQGPR